jgi:hypothetical protein
MLALVVPPLIKNRVQGKCHHRTQNGPNLYLRKGSGRSERRAVGTLRYGAACTAASATVRFTSLPAVAVKERSFAMRPGRTTASL